MTFSPRALLATAALAALLPATAVDAQALRRNPPRITLAPIGSYDSGLRDESAAEIVAHDPANQQLFVINAAASSIDVLDIADPTRPSLRSTLTEVGGDANSVAVRDGLVAVAFAASPKTDPGKVVFYDARTLEKLAETAVGALPDMLTFTPNGDAVLVANEGEPNEGYTIDPVGSVSVIDLRLMRNCLADLPRPAPLGARRDCRRNPDLAANLRVRTVGFESLNGSIDALRAAGVRIYGPGASVAQDLEPEYIAVAPNGRTAMVALQEANAFAEIDISNLDAPALLRILPLGRKDHSLPGNELDASDRDNAINIRNWPVKGLYQPDAIAAFTAGRETFYVTANEGDDRNDFIPGEETVRVRSLGAAALDPAVFGDVEALRDNAALGRLTVSPATSARNAAGQLTELEALGGRSFSIRDANGFLVFDSGADFERITAERYGTQFFNASNDNNNFEDRSDNKGPEPEGVVVGKVRGRTFAFIGLERIGGVMIYDVTVPAESTFVDYINVRDFTLDPTGAAPTDSGPEGLAFIEAQDSPTRRPLLVIGNEVSGTTTIYSVDLVR